MSNPSPVTDPYGYLGIVKNPDGTITRDDTRFPCTPPSPDPNHPNSVLSKDIPVNESKSTWVRLFLPTQSLGSSSKLPLVVYFHGGGFVLGRVDWTFHHDFCAEMARVLHAVVLAPSYRLAPENRLPAAYEDGDETLRWIKTASDEWLNTHADLENCYLMGTSAGGNLAYFVGLRAAHAPPEDLGPVKIRGMILHHPFFGGVERTPSEIRLTEDPVLPPVVSDIFWEMCLPVGVDRDHEYCNPTVDGGPEALSEIGRLGWKVMVLGCEGDPLIERQREVVRMMKEKGVNVVGEFSEGESHGVEIMDPSKAALMFVVLKDFLSFQGTD